MDLDNCDHETLCSLVYEHILNGSDHAELVEHKIITLKNDLVEEFLRR